MAAAGAGDAGLTAQVVVTRWTTDATFFDSRGKVCARAAAERRRPTARPQDD
jgi:hypothetical protein